MSDQQAVAPSISRNTGADAGQDIRSLIVTAAAQLRRRVGAEAVTLGGVARAAGLAREAVYAEFSSPEEILAALPQQDGEEDGSEEDYDALMRAQAEALQQLQNQVLVAAPRPREATEAALLRLEARLAVTEQNVAALDQRFSERIKRVEVDTGSLAERFHAIRQRLEKFEERQNTALAQLRLEVSKGAPPSTPIRAARSLAQAQALAEAAPLPEKTVPEGTAEEQDHAPGCEVRPGAAESSGPMRPPAYLSIARLSAIEAAERVEAKPKPKPWYRKVSRRRWALLAMAAVLVAWFDVYVFVHYPAAGATTAAAYAVRAVPQVSDPQAQLLRGVAYLKGEGVAPDPDQARRWLERAARAGQPVAQNLVGFLYQTGTGVRLDLANAVAWYEIAAGHGNVQAMTNLGKLYAGGWKDGIDYVKAAAWFARAASYGDVDAAFDLAILYERGAGVPRNVGLAYQWYTIAGALGDEHAKTRADVLGENLPQVQRQAADEAVAAFAPHQALPRANAMPQKRS